VRRAATTPLPSSPLRGSDAERIPRVLWGVLVLTVLYHGGLLLHGTYKVT